MPWVKQEDCVGCGICVEECPAGAISLDEGKASIDDDTCITCGRCHDVCPQEAVRHDGERIGEEVEANIQWVRGLMKHYHTASDREAFLERMERYFNREGKVIEKTMAKLKSLK